MIGFRDSLWGRHGADRIAPAILKYLFTKIRQLLIASGRLRAAACAGLGRENKMAATAFSSRDSVKTKLADIENESFPAGTGTGPVGLENEFRLMRAEFAQLREHLLDRETKGKALTDAYREVIADFADLFESQRKENIKRDESLRFFLGSIEGRIKTDIRSELSGGGKKRRGWWPFRKSG